MLDGLFTPRLSKMVGWKYAHLSAGAVAEDFEQHHGRPMSRCLIQRISEAVGALAVERGRAWDYVLPDFSQVVTHISIGRDGTTTPILKEGYRETMTGTLSLYNAKEGRMHTIYVACAPEHGKKSFDEALGREIDKLKERYPAVRYIGLADGAKDNWTYLEARTSIHILDFYHATERLAKLSVVMGSNEEKRKKWLDETCSDLKHKNKAAAMLLREMEAKRQQLGETVPEVLSETITYFENNLKRMNYPAYQKIGYPIGSGVTEAACKTVVKQRLSQSGMRWNIDPTQRILHMRAIVLTKGRWEQFWNHATKKSA